MAGFVPAEVFPPGTTIQAELEELGWTQVDLAEVMGRPPKTINGLLAGKVRVTEKTAKELELALEIDADFWMRSEAYYRLHSSKKAAPSAISKRAEIRRRVPVLRQMAARGWITLVDDPDELRHRVENFLDGPIDEPVTFTMAAKQSSYNEPLSAAQKVWLLRAKQLAEGMPLPAYSRVKLVEAVEQMRELLWSPDDARRVPGLLSDAGVRFVVVERLPGLKIDGVCFWLKEGTRPVIAMSLTSDRIDNFWFVLRHEIEHVLRGDGKDGAFVVDTNLEETADVSEQERRANGAASDFCVPRDKMEDFVNRKGPLFNNTNIRQFAHANGIHPGLVAGQLRMRLSKGPLGSDAWKRFTSHLVKIRHVVTSTALVDGFGSTPQLGL